MKFLFNLLILLGNLQELFTIFSLFTVAITSVTSHEWPSPFTNNNRVLSLLLSYGFMRFDPILEILREYRTMCNAGWDPTVVIFTASEVSERMIRYLNNKVYCHRTEVR